MLNGILITVVPMVVTLAAAFFLFRRANRNNDDAFHFGGGGHPTGPRPSSDHAQPPSGSSVVRRRVVAPLMEDALFPSECTVCFERQCNTELYPCGHRDICAECVDTIVSKLNAECPFCRQSIAAVNYY